MKSTTTLGEAKRIVCFFSPRSYLSGCSNNSGAGSTRPELTQPLSPTLMASIPCVQRFLCCIAFSVYKVVQVACLSCSWFVYAPGRKQTTATRQNQAPLLIFAHAHEPKFGLYKMFFLANLFWFFCSLSFFFLGLSLWHTVLFPSLSSFFCMELRLANLFGKGQI